MAGTLTLAPAATLTFDQTTPVTGVLNAFATAAATASPSALTLATPTVTRAAPFTDNADLTNYVYTTQQLNSNGTVTQTSYTAIDAAGLSTGVDFSRHRHHRLHGRGRRSRVPGVDPDFDAGGSLDGFLTQNGIDLVQLGTTGESVVTAGADTTTTVTAANALAAVNAALTAVTSYASTIGATQDRMTSASTFNTSLSTNLESGISGLVDANMNTASTQLQALQTQEQLGIQSLSIANQNAQLILKLFS